MCLMFGLISYSAAFAAEAQVREFTVGKATVWAIADAVNDREMSAFPAADPEVISKYVPSGRTPAATMAFLIKIEDELILIDTGMGNPSGERASRLPDGLKQIRVAPEEITMILITHMHGDHIGGMLREEKKAFPSARVLSAKVEYDFWLDEKSVEIFPERKAGFEMAGKLFDIYGSVAETFEFDAEVAPGITALDIRGHTPGHTAYLLESEGDKLLFWGDILHAAALQFPRPDINAQFDMNPEGAAAARVRILEKAAEEKLAVAGSHLPFPGIGTVEKNSEGGYAYASR